MSPGRRRRDGESDDRGERRRSGGGIDVAADRGVFMISVAASLAEMHPQTLRTYETRGLLEPSRSAKGTRLYSQADVARLRRIQQMTAELGLNLAGVERVLELEAQLDAAHSKLAALEAEALAARAAMNEELDRVRRSMRAEIVPYAKGSKALVRAVDAARSPWRAAGRRGGR